MRFLNREDAGRQLARILTEYKRDNPLVLGLPRGGVPVAAAVAAGLEAPLDVWVVRKVGAPAFPELGLGAVAEGGIVYLNPDVIAQTGASDIEIRDIVREQSAEVARRVRMFRGDRPAPALAGRTIILIDDGIATGGTVRAAVQALRVARPKKIVLAVPVAATQSLDEIAPLVEDIVCLYATPELYAVGAWYDDFHQVPDDVVVRLLAEAHGMADRTSAKPSTIDTFDPVDVVIPIGPAQLPGTLAGPAEPRGLVLFAHGSGSGRLSPRNRHVAATLHDFGLATLLFDLLTPDEAALDEENARFRFDIDLLARRLLQATDWALGSPRLGGLPLGYFGSSTGAAAALVAAARRPAVVEAIVSRGGRPDLAWASLGLVRAPTLLIVGGADRQVLELNHHAAGQLVAPHRLVVIPGATHLFEEPGTLDAVARLAGEWFQGLLGQTAVGAVAGVAVHSPPR